MSCIEPLSSTAPTPHMGPTLPTVPVQPNVSSQPIEQAVAGFPVLFMYFSRHLVPAFKSRDLFECM